MNEERKVLLKVDHLEQYFGNLESVLFKIQLYG